MVVGVVKPNGHYLSETKMISISSWGIVMFTIGCELDESLGWIVLKQDKMRIIIIFFSGLF